MTDRILIVEDNPANLKLLREVLERDGYDVVTAADAHRGLELAFSERLDLIIMDIQLPGMDGLQATRKLKRDERTRDIPVVAVTAYAMRGDEARTLAAGCDHYVAKPIRYKALLELIHNVLAAR